MVGKLLVDIKKEHMQKMINNLVGELVNRYLKQYKNLNILTKESYSAYEYDLNFFFNFLEDTILKKKLKELQKSGKTKDIELIERLKNNQYLIEDITDLDVMEFIEYLTERENGDRAIARKISVLKSFFKYLKERKLITENIMDYIKIPKIREKVLVKPSQDQINYLLDYVEQKVPSKINGEMIKYRNSKSPLPADFEKRSFILYFNLLASSMARRIEMIRIRVKDFNFENNELKLFGKGDKERIVDIDEYTINLVKNYVKDIGLKEEDYLIRNYRNERISKVALHKRIKKITLETGLPEWITTHKIRKGIASTGSEKGIPLEMLQDALGHSDPKTTRIYVITEREKMRAMYREKHPLLDRNSVN